MMGGVEDTNVFIYDQQQAATKDCKHINQGLNKATVVFFPFCTKQIWTLPVYGVFISI